ncbi:nucleotide-binding protein [Candidatus Micrarchaeota archaeon]|nr:nucleotide-binding protein [Candidatus Micrarchaeota archaeon]
MPPRAVIIDTNFLLIPFKFRIDILTELERLIDVHRQFVITSKTVKELENLAENAGKQGAGARLALKILDANKKGIEIVESNKPVDLWIEEYAEKHGAIVCTNDIELKKKLKDNGIKVVSLRGKTKIDYV